jgi:hypothetical protein
MYAVSLFGVQYIYTISEIYTVCLALSYIYMKLNRRWSIPDGSVPKYYVNDEFQVSNFSWIK